MDREPIVFEESIKSELIKFKNGLLLGIANNWQSIYSMLSFLKSPRYKDKPEKLTEILLESSQPALTYQQYLDNNFSDQSEKILQQSSPKVIQEHDDLARRWNELIDNGTPSIEQLEKFRDEVDVLLGNKITNERQSSDSY